MTLNPGDNDWVLCLSQWDVQYVNDGHVCLLAEVFTPGTSAPGSDFAVPTDSRVGQLNLNLVAPVKAMNFVWVVPVEIHNVTLSAQEFEVYIERGTLEELKELARQLPGIDLSNDGVLESVGFVSDRCGNDGELGRGETRTTVALGPGERAQVFASGRTTEGVTVVHVTQRFAASGKYRSGGVTILADAHRR